MPAPPILPTANKFQTANVPATASDHDASDHERDLLTVTQAAAFLQLSQSSVRSYIREGKLKAFRIAGLRKVLIARAELMKLLELVEPAR